MKRVVFRVDSSTQIGSGHLMRCLTLADRLASQAKILFVCRNLERNLTALIRQRGFQTIFLPQVVERVSLQGYEAWLGVKRTTDAEQMQRVLKNERADCLIVDHYALDESWETPLRPDVGKIMVIDDLADRRHNCDLLLDQNYHAETGDKYKGLLPERCRCFLGLSYLLLRPEFHRAKAAMRARNGSVRRVLVFFGGSDPTGETRKALEAIRILNEKQLVFDVVVGSANAQKEDLAAKCRELENVNFYCQIDYIAELMIRADLAIGALGATTWERCFLGLPSLVISVADNQGREARISQASAPFFFLGWHSDVSPEIIAAQLRHFIAAPEVLREMGRRALRLFPKRQGGGELVREILRDEKLNFF